MGASGRDPVTIVIGAGLTGLTAAVSVGRSATVLESEARPGGCLRTDRAGEYLVDRTGHLFHMRSKTVMALLARGTAIDWLTHSRDARVQIGDRLQPYPIQYNLAGLDPETVAECVVGGATARPIHGRGIPFETWARQNFGDGLWRLFFEPYNRKLWQCDLSEMTSDWTGRFVPQPDLRRMVLGGFIEHRVDDSGYNATFAYPRVGASQSIPDALATAVHDVRYGVDVSVVNWRSREVRTESGLRLGFDRLISTVPLTRLVDMLAPVVPELAEARDCLRHTSIGYVALAGATPVPDWHWVYLADPSVRPFRLGNLGAYGEGLAPQGESLLCVERSFFGQGAAHVSDDELVDGAMQVVARRELGLDATALRPVLVGRLDPAYVIFDRRRASAVRMIRRWLAARGVVSTGRYGAWTYGSAGDAILQGISAARWVLLARESDRRVSGE